MAPLSGRRAGFLWTCVSSLNLAQVLCDGVLEEQACREATDRLFADELLMLSGAQVLARPGVEFESAFDISEHRLIHCRSFGHVPWRFGHNMICVPAACDTEELVRAISLPVYLNAIGAWPVYLATMEVELPALVLRDMVVQRLAHWSDMHVSFAVAGFESGGTTSLVAQLRAAPDIYMLPFELSDWGGTTHEPPACGAPLAGPPSYWPAFMSFAFWPTSETVGRVNAQVARCASGKVVGVWDSRYAAHPLAVRKLRALLEGKAAGRVVLSFRDPVRYVVSAFNRMDQDALGGMSFAAVVAGQEVSGDPYQLQLWKGNYSVLAEGVISAVGEERVLVQPFEVLLAKPVASYGRILRFLGSSAGLPSFGELDFPHENRGPPQPLARVDPCAGEHRRQLRRLVAIFRPEYRRLAALLARLGAEVPQAVRHEGPDFDCRP